jgi:hypothetical protein
MDTGIAGRKDDKQYCVAQISFGSCWVLLIGSKVETCCACSASNDATDCLA